MTFACILFAFIFMFLLRQIFTFRTYAANDLNPYITQEELEEYNDAVEEIKVAK